MMEHTDELHQLERAINDSLPSTVPAIKQRVEALFEDVIGIYTKRLSVEEKSIAGDLVKGVITTIQKRLKRKPEVDLFQTHSVCLTYLKYLCGVFSSQETPYEYLERWCGLIDCYEHLSRYKDVEREGSEVLDVFHKSLRKRKRAETAGSVRLQVLLPNTNDHRQDIQTVKVVTTVGMALLRARWSYIKDSEESEADCQLFLSLVKEMEPWIVHYPLSSEVRLTFLGFLKDCTRSLLEKPSQLMSECIIEICTTTLTQLSYINEMCDFGREVFSLFLSKNVFWAVVKVLDRISERCIKHPLENIMNSFLELAGYCTVNFGAASKSECADLLFIFRFLAPQVNLPVAHMVLKRLVTTLLLKDLDFYRQYGVTALGISNSEVSDDLEAHLEEWGHFNNKQDVHLDHLFFYDRLSSFILSDRTIDALNDNTDPMKLLKIEDVFQHFIDEFSSDRSTDIKVAAKVGVAYFIFQWTTEQNVEKSNLALRKLIRKKPKVLKYLIQSLKEVSQALEKNARMKEAIESRTLSYKLQWEHLLSFCEMISSRRHGVDRGFSEYMVVGFAEKAYEDFAVLLELLNKLHGDEMKEMFRDFLETWHEVEKLFCIPHPVDVVRQWVKIQYENTQEKGAFNNVPTIGSIVPSLLNSSQFLSILSEELKQYQDNGSSNPDLCRYMVASLRSLISETKLESYKLDLSIRLINCGARLASCGSICRSDSIKYTDRAISILPTFGILGACGSQEECLHCLPSLCEKSSSFKATIQTKWECIRRSHWVRLATRLGKCSKLKKDANKEYMYLKSSLCVLVSRSAFNLKEVSTSFVDKLLRHGVMGVAYTVEHAAILYKICCFSLMNKDAGVEVDKLSMESVVVGLKLAFILSREVHKLHKKVSRVLAVLYAYQSEDAEFSTLKDPSMSQCATYFHQSSIGNYFNTFLLSKDQNPEETDDLRKVLAPHSLDVLNTSVSQFFETLPEFTLLCLSMLNEKSDKFLKNLLPESPTSAWIMISRISRNSGTLLVILPIREKFEDFQFETHIPLVCNWTCPWAHGVFDKLAPVLRKVLEENNKLLSSRLNVNELREYRSKLDKHFVDLLRGLEDSWFGPLIYLLLGDWSDNNDIGSLPDQRMDIRSLKDVIEVVNGCYIQRSKSNDERKKQLMTQGVQTILKRRGDDTICRNPVILVLDSEIQMFPLENMPLLQNETIYRMPSVGTVMSSSSKRKDPKKGKTTIDPRSCFYMFFTDCEETISCFNRWSKFPHFEGHCISDTRSTEKLETLGIITLDTLKHALESHDLFVYSGHGDGRQYIRGDEIRKVNASCAVCLFGCSSGYISNGRSRVPNGPLSDYLLGGCPVIISNLWQVTGATNEVLATKMLESMLNAAPAMLVDCSHKQETVCGATCLCIHQSDVASLFIGAREIESDRIYKVDLAGTVIYGLPTSVVRNLSIDDMQE